MEKKKWRRNTWWRNITRENEYAHSLVPLGRSPIHVLPHAHTRYLTIHVYLSVVLFCRFFADVNFLSPSSLKFKY